VRGQVKLYVGTNTSTMETETRRAESSLSSAAQCTPLAPPHVRSCTQRSIDHPVAILRRTAAVAHQPTRRWNNVNRLCHCTYMHASDHRCPSPPGTQRVDGRTSTKGQSRFASEAKPRQCNRPQSSISAQGVVNMRAPTKESEHLRSSMRRCKSL